MSEEKVKKPSYYATIPQEQKKEFYEKIQAKRKETIEAKKKEHEETLLEAKRIVPKIIAEQFAHEITNPGDIENWVPSNDLVQTFKNLSKKGNSIDHIREKYLTNIPDEYWHRFLKHLFRSQVSTVEDVGAEVMMTHRLILRKLELRMRQINRQIKIYCEEKGTKIIPGYLLALKKETEDSQMKHLAEKIQIFSKIGVVGEKVKSPTLHLHMNTPRPEKKEKVIEVQKTPVLNLDDLLNGSNKN